MSVKSCSIVIDIARDAGVGMGSALTEVVSAV